MKGAPYSAEAVNETIQTLADGNRIVQHSSAMQYRDSESFDLAILDVHLNGKTVFPFAQELEERDIPFLFVTAYGPRGVPEQFRHHHILQKPFGPVELRRALMELPVAV